MRQYLYIDQLAEVTPWTEEAIRTMIARGQFQLGVHYFQPHGPNGRRVFSWKAVVEYIEGRGNSKNLETICLANGTVIDLDEAKAEIHALLSPTA